MPPISSHTLRHTGCTRLGENNVNPKVMQYVMGHSDAQITMNVYNHIAEKSHVENEMSKIPVLRLCRYFHELYRCYKENHGFL